MAQPLENNGSSNLNSTGSGIKLRANSEGVPMSHDDVDTNFENLRLKVNEVIGEVGTNTTKLSGIATGANNYSLPLATSTVRGGIELFSNTDQSVAANSASSTSGRTYGIQLNSANQAVVNVPWTNTTYSTATSSTAGIIKLGSGTTQTTGANSVTTTGSRTYAVQKNSSSQLVVNVPWTDSNTTYSTATSSTAGLVKIGYTENAKNYPVELSSGKMFVNVPWTDTDTNTTYTAGTGISISGTTISATGGGGSTDIEANTAGGARTIEDYGSGIYVNQNQTNFFCYIDTASGYDTTALTEIGDAGRIHHFPMSGNKRFLGAFRTFSDFEWAINKAFPGYVGGRMHVQMITDCDESQSQNPDGYVIGNIGPDIPGRFDLFVLAAGKNSGDIAVKWTIPANANRSRLIWKDSGEIRIVGDYLIVNKSPNFVNFFYFRSCLAQFNARIGITNAHGASQKDSIVYCAAGSQVIQYGTGTGNPTAPTSYWEIYDEQTANPSADVIYNSKALITLEDGGRYDMDTLNNGTVQWIVSGNYHTCNVVNGGTLTLPSYHDVTTIGTSNDQWAGVGFKLYDGSTSGFSATYNHGIYGQAGVAFVPAIQFWGMGGAINLRKEHRYDEVAGTNDISHRYTGLLGNYLRYDWNLARPHQDDGTSIFGVPANMALPGGYGGAFLDPSGPNAYNTMGYGKMQSPNGTVHTKVRTYTVTSNNAFTAPFQTIK